MSREIQAGSNTGWSRSPVIRKAAIAPFFTSPCSIGALNLECFGPQRLMCGSDWPVLLLNGDYDRVWDAALTLASLAGRDAGALLGENAARIYRFSDGQSPTTTPVGDNAWQHR